MSEPKADAPNLSIWTVVLASSAGTVIEWYDFYLYGSLAVFFSTLFYPANDPTAAVLISVATFATGFVIRPFGAILFGSLGDRLGRKHTFLLTLILMGISTTASAFCRHMKLSALLHLSRWSCSVWYRAWPSAASTVALPSMWLSMHR
ncbi:MFS transporter [Bradyrhizobium sp. CW10]|uniref:MFS transporter n=1 Tax=Bradyrhizobium sp. CW10 TaxID=2782683 RepID=UPI001FF90A4D|nr:MFS transporter [Bradyrhizobium sp. CW10]